MFLKLDNTKFSIPVLLECCTGIEHEEFCSLYTADFDFRDGEHAFIEIKRAVTDIHGVKLLKETKTQFNTRIVAIDGQLSLYLYKNKNSWKKINELKDYKSPFAWTR